MSAGSLAATGAPDPALGASRRQGAGEKPPFCRNVFACSARRSADGVALRCGSCVRSLTLLKSKETSFRGRSDLWEDPVVDLTNLPQ